jgi:phosphate acetyltransferase
LENKSFFIEKVMAKARKSPRHIVYPEGEDKRILDAAVMSVKEKIITKATVLGSRKDITDYYKKSGCDAGLVNIVEPAQSPDMEKYITMFYELRKNKGLTTEQARETLKSNTYFATMMLYEGKADGLVSGAGHSTADTVRPALQIIKTAPNTSIVSSIFFMCFKDRAFVFSDSGLVENPDEKQLADIAIQSALSAIQFDIEPRVALLSYSTKGSANSPLTEKVVNATKIAKEKLKANYSNLPIKLDGEMQGDAALVRSVAEKKCPGSDVMGDATILIFPDLNAGNISYKLVERLGGAEAYGPILQGLKKPVNDLSRGCKADDVVGVTAITVVQSQLNKQ